MKQLTVVFCSHVLAAHLYRSDDNGGGRQPQRSRSHSKTPGGGSSGDRRKQERQARHRSPSHEEEGQITDRYSSCCMRPRFREVYFTVFVEHIVISMSSYNIWAHVSLWLGVCDFCMVSY